MPSHDCIARVIPDRTQFVAECLIAWAQSVAALAWAKSSRLMARPPVILMTAKTSVDIIFEFDQLQLIFLLSLSSKSFATDMLFHHWHIINIIVY